MNFGEVSIFQVNPTKLDKFESEINNLRDHFKDYAGLINLKIIKRTHRIKDMESIRAGKPALRITRIVKSVKYILYWEFEDEISHGLATKEYFEIFHNNLSKFLIMPPDKYIGISI
ncbi:MAG: hypothetical protein PWQ77_1394 [Kosmotogales bacterium]|nr:hypothetical protein [Kosmotogales bacterium]